MRHEVYAALFVTICGWLHEIAGDGRVSLDVTSRHPEHGRATPCP